MGRLGRPDAVRTLRRYVEVGRNWEWAIAEMARRVPLGLSGLDEVVVARCPSLDDLAGVLRSSGRFPWSSWRATNARIREAFALSDEWDEQNDRRRQDMAKVPTRELLERRNVSPLRKRTSAADKEVLYEAARGDVDQLRHDAIKVLGWQRDRAVFDLAEAELRRSPEVDFNAGWFALFQLIKDGPIEQIRDWLGEPDKTGQFALHMIAAWPRDGDQPLLRSVLVHVNDDEWLYLVCDAVDGLAELVAKEAVPELERVYREARYSYLRRRAARALAITSDRFAESYAVECLWDCEEETRALGCAVASWASAAVRKRIAEMAGDRFEDRKVRVLAARRQRPLRA